MPLVSKKESSDSACGINSAIHHMNRLNIEDKERICRPIPHYETIDGISERNVTLSAAMLELFKNPILSDITLQAVSPNGKVYSFPVHSPILIARSELFESVLQQEYAPLQNEMKILAASEIGLGSMLPSVLHAILIFIYTGRSSKYRKINKIFK